jgi:uncharacterized protein (TIGR02246 family)
MLSRIKLDFSKTSNSIHNELVGRLDITKERMMGQSADEQAVRQIEHQWDEAWNRHDAKALSALLSEDVDFVNVMGAWFKGRTEFEQRMVQTHRGPFRTSKRKTTEIAVKFLSPIIAVVLARWEMSGLHNADGTPRDPWEGIITRVVQKIGTEWTVVAAHNVDVAGGATKPSGL